MQAPPLQPIWLHDHDYGRDAGGADCSAALRRLFLLEARDCRDCVLRVLVLREFSIYRDVYGGWAGAGIAASRFGRPRLGHIVRGVGVVDEGPENWRGAARGWVDGNERGGWGAGVADLPEAAGGGKRARGGVRSPRS